jgi:hypothetical protein
VGCVRAQTALDAREGFVAPVECFQALRQAHVIRAGGSRVGRIAPLGERLGECVAVSGPVVQFGEFQQPRGVQGLQFGGPREGAPRALDLIGAVARECGDVQPELAPAARVAVAQHLDLALV